MPRFVGVPKQFGGAIGRRGGTGGFASNVRIIGIPQAIAKLTGVDSVVRLNLGQIAAGASILIERRAKEIVQAEAHRTGNLESGIHRERVGPYAHIVVASSMDGSDPGGEGKSSYEYAPFVETGTSKMKGIHFMQRAYAEASPLVAVELRALAAKLERL
jgi:HK97 gp10 family phage protein